MRTIRATVEYDGTGFAGFQQQLCARTVQGTLEEAVASVVGAPVKVTGAGRTDAGVHARGQVVSFRVSTGLEDPILMRAVNARLPADVVLRSMATVEDAFHATRLARERVYQYRILQRPQRSPLDRERAWHVARQLDLAAMQEAADHLIGVHDFAAFSVGHQPRTTRSIRAAVVWSEGGSVFIRIAGNAFLHRMVRRIVGTLVRVGLGDLPAVKVERFLQGGNRAGAGPAAPAHGLTLTHVAYPGDEEAVSAPTRSQAAAR